MNGIEMNQKFCDRIIVEGISCYTLIGVADHERIIGQNLIINIEAFCDLKSAGETDSLEDTISYVELSQTIQKVSTQKEYKLLEHLSAEICKEIFVLFPAVQAISLRIVKPHIPNRDFKGQSSVYIYRERN